ncbi:hypothetical protein GGR56DRAFT_688754 [Xylariaceae sp. FL0804]|nr:hypothetical protein GGR56DRAFT_688754 [Xylariaceae sp. FL0804]
MLSPTTAAARLGLASLLAAACCWLGGAAAQTTVMTVTTQTIGGWSGSHTDIPRWCGKAYEAGSPNFAPGGMLAAPAPAAATPLLHVQLAPRYSVYDSSEATAELVVDAALSRIHGAPFPFPFVVPGNTTGGGATAGLGALEFDVRVEATGQLLVAGGRVAVNTTGSRFPFDLDALRPRLEPYRIVLHGSVAAAAPASARGGQTTGSGNYTAAAELYYLPAKNSGSTVKVDRLNGGLLVANNATGYAFAPLLPFGFYTSCSGYLQYSQANVSAYRALGFNAINPVCAFTDGDIGYLFDWMDEDDLWYQYDMRGSYLNLTSVAEQVPLVKDRSNLLSWYTADEPDGWQYALNSTRLAYDLLRRMDPYHPTGLVLNCDNYYFGAYASGADFVMEDAYPVGINATWSEPYGVPCNETYGDCGCDDCAGSLRDVSDRLDAFFDYQLWLDEWEKPLWAVLQAFSGEGYWSRDPTPRETWAMAVLALNHAAKAVMSWTFPASAALEAAHGRIARVAAVAPVSDFLLGAQPAAVAVPGHGAVDVAYWVLGAQVMVGVANLDYAGSSSSNRTVEIDLPVVGGARRIAAQPWGSVAWVLGGNGTTLAARGGLAALATSFVILDL